MGLKWFNQNIFIDKCRLNIAISKMLSANANSKF